MSVRSREAGDYYVRSVAFPESKPRVATWMQNSKGEMAWFVPGLVFSFPADHFVPVCGPIRLPDAGSSDDDPIVDAVRVAVESACGDDADSLRIAHNVVWHLIGSGFQILPAGEVQCES